MKPDFIHSGDRKKRLLGRSFFWNDLFFLHISNRNSTCSLVYLRQTPRLFSLVSPSNALVVYSLRPEWESVAISYDRNNQIF